MPVIILAIVVTLLSACSEKPHDARLTRVAELTDSVPEDALALLDSIDASTLSDADRHYFDFLTVKASDKAYIDHTSDSLILDVIDYYRGKDLYPEALYYGGRVYSDLGDYPTSLEYFHRSLDLLPSDTDNPKLKYRVLSQTGRLLNSLRLYDEAIPYIEASLEILRSEKDTTAIVYDLQLLGDIHLGNYDAEKAEDCFREALRLSRNLRASFRAKSSMYLAAAKYYQGETDSALAYIRNTLDSVSPLARNTVLSYATKIYSDAGIKDTAALYAVELINSDNPTNKETAYHALLSSELRDAVEIDSIKSHFSDYLLLLEDYYNQNENQLAVNQQALYNYQIHERERKKSEHANRILILWIVVFSFVVLALIVIVLALKNRNKTVIIKLHEAIERLELQKQELTKRDSDQTPSDAKCKHAEKTHFPIESAETLRSRLRQKLLEMSGSQKQTYSVPAQILMSEAYQKLQQHILTGNELKENDRLWKEIEEVVLTYSPHLIENIQILVGGKLSSYDLHTVLLIECGVAPTQMGILMNRAKGTIVSRRESLGFCIFGEKLKTTEVDAVIRLL